MVLAIAGLGAGTILLIGSVALLAAGAPGAGRAGITGLIVLAWATVVGSVSALGLYVIRIYKDVRGRPPYIVASKIGWEP
jgi:dolichol-phosphate mannosyltransferase